MLHEHVDQNQAVWSVFRRRLDLESAAARGFDVRVRSAPASAVRASRGRRRGVLVRWRPASATCMVGRVGCEVRLCDRVPWMPVVRNHTDTSRLHPVFLNRNRTGARCPDSSLVHSDGDRRPSRGTDGSRYPRFVPSSSRLGLWQHCSLRGVLSRLPPVSF